MLAVIFARLEENLMLEWLSDPEIWASLVTLSVLEVVLGIDNLVILAVVTDRLPPSQRRMAQRAGLAGALVMRIILLSSVVWIAGLTQPVFSLRGIDFTWRDIIFFVGGAFLILKGSTEIHAEVNGEIEEAAHKPARERAGWGLVLVMTQIMAFDLIFSLDSVIAAVGMTDNLPVMIAAVTLAILTMLFLAEATSRFIKEHPSVKMLALSFLLLIGTSLVADSFHQHIPRGFLYFAIAFSMFVEMMNLLRRRKAPKKG
jgi:predicted tellurium resistance membrane protein TerC